MPVSTGLCGHAGTGGNKHETRTIFGELPAGLSDTPAYETGEIRLLLRTDNVCAEKDTGWQLLQGSETGLELSNPGNSLLVSVARALEIEPKLAPFLTADTPPQKAAYAYDEKTAGYRPTAYPEDVPTEI